MITADSVRLTRTISAPPDAVYRAFVDPELVSTWFGPGGFRVEHVDIDPRVGGAHRVAVSGPDGVRGTFACEFRELVPNERIVLSWSWEFDPPRHEPQDSSLLTITFREISPGTTELALVHTRLGGPPDEDPAGIEEAWNQALEKLEKLAD